MEVARGQGAGSSPTKYGLKGTMPAIVKRTEGSCGIRLAEGTMVWPLSAKKRVKAARSPLASIAAAYRGQKRIRGRSGAEKVQAGARVRCRGGQAVRRSGGQADDMPTMGLFSCMPPV